VKLAYSKLLELTLKGLGRSATRKASLVWGEEMTVVYPEIASLGIARYGFFGEGLTRMLLSHLKPEMTFIDVGAQLGYFTLLASWLVGESGHVHSFEPTLNTFNLLTFNTQSKPNIHLNRVAVASGRGTAVLNDYGPSLSAFNSIYDAKLPDRTRPARADRFLVETISIDEYLSENIVAPDFIKIDAENADYDILTGMGETLSRFKPVLSVEVGDNDIEGVPLSKDIVRFLVHRGYQPFEYRDGSIVAHKTQERYDHGDLFFLPQN
jgi:FkbM family methyltransferase